MFKGLPARVGRDRITWTEPVGGCTLWVKVLGGRVAEERRLVDRARAAGVLVTPGSLSFAEPPDGLFLRLSIAKAKVHEIDEGCRRLARAIAPR